MPGSEVFGQEELDAIAELWERTGGVGYRYVPVAYAAGELERQFAEKIGSRYAYAVSSGTAAIHTALAALGVGPGDEVITTCFTFIAPVEAILSLGAEPVPVEIDETYHLDPAEVEKKITERTKAIVAVPMWAACDNDRLMALANKHKVTFVEDSAQNLFGTYRGRCTGTFGLIGSFSFDWGKTMTTGEGGMVVTDDEALYRVASEYADHGHVHDPNLTRASEGRRAPGLNFRLSEYHAAVGLAQLAKVDDVLARQRENWRRVEERLSRIDGIRLRDYSDREGQIASTLFTRFPTRRAAQAASKKLLERGVVMGTCPTSIGWHFAGYWTHIFNRFDGYDVHNLASHWPRSDRILHESVELFISSKFTAQDCARLADTFEEVVAEVLS